MFIMENNKIIDYGAMAKDKLFTKCTSAPQYMTDYDSDDGDDESTKSDTSEFSIEDLTVATVGEFGIWQLRISILMALLKLPMAWYQLNIIFMAPPQEFWCKKPDTFFSMSNQEWRRICAPSMEEHPCLIFDPKEMLQNPSKERYFVNLVPCTKFEYDCRVFNRTIISDWDLVCSRHWLVHFTQCVMMWGVLVGSILFAVIADKYGRRPTLMLTIIIQSIASFLISVMPTYWSFIVVWFILALASGGCGVVSFVISMEVASGKWRTIIPVLYQLPYGLGNAVMAGLAYWLRDWRMLEFALATLSSFFLLYWFWIPESPRWLLAAGKYDEALEILKRASKQNKMQYNSEYVKLLLPKRRITPNIPGILDYMKSKNMRNKTILLSINWFCIGLAFYAFSQYLGSLGRNIFLTVALSGIISAPGSLICVLIISKMGRKVTLCSFEILTALCFVCILLIPKDMFSQDWPRMMFAGLGFIGMAGSIPALYLFSGELYPTLGRNIGVSAVSMFARIGSMMAPAVVSLATVLEDLPLYILAVVSFAQIFLLVPLPETKYCPLPDTLEDAEKYTKEYIQHCKRQK